MHDRHKARLEAIKGFEYRQYLDANKLYEWLTRDHPEIMEGRSSRCSEAVLRRLYEWSVTPHPLAWHEADKILIQMDIHVDHEVPDECWLTEPDKFHSSTKSHLREQALDLLEEGKEPHEVSKEIGVSRGIIHRWRSDQEFREAAKKNWYRGRLEQAGLVVDPEHPGKVVAA